MKRQRGGGHTQHHVDQIRGQPACRNPRPPLFLSFPCSPHPRLPPPTFPSLHLCFRLPTPNLTLPSFTITPYSFFTVGRLRETVCTDVEEGGIVGRMYVRKFEVKTLHSDTHKPFSHSSPRLVSASRHGRFSLPSLVEHRVHEFEDVGRTELDGGARTQHSRLDNALPVYKRVCVRAVRRHSHHAFAVHEVAVVGQNPRTKQLKTNTASISAT